MKLSSYCANGSFNRLGLLSTTAYLEEIARPVPNRGYPNRP